MRGTQWRTLINHLIGLNASLASYEISFARIVEEVTYIVIYVMVKGIADKNMKMLLKF